MSFILDALRKSENERQRAAIPGISDVPAVAHRTRIPRWTLGVMAGLAACIVLLGWAWLRGGDAETQPSTAFSTVQDPPPDASRPVTTGDFGAVRDLAGETRQATGSATVEASPRGPDPTTASASQPGNPVAFASPVATMAQIQASGAMLPELNLELHVYSTSPAERFVFINSAKYREGESLAEGPRILAITDGGVVLNYRNQSFLLPRE